MSCFKLREWKKGRGRLKITLMKVVKNDISVKEVIEYDFWVK